MAADSEATRGTAGAAPRQSLALYRKYRPATFAEVRGQEHVTEPLRQALRSGRINHAYLFSGPRGCGKTSSARILARSLNCVNGPTPDPCGVCDSCVALAPSGPGQHRRDRDRRGQPRRRGRRPRPARARLLRPGRRPLQDLHHRRGAHGDAAGLQRPAQARRGTAAAPEVHLRDHRAGEGHPDDQVADAPLPVPAHAAVGDARAHRGDPQLRARRRSTRPCCRWWCGRAAARRGTRCPSSTSSSPAPTRRGSGTTARSRCSATPTRACSTRSWTRSRRADGAAVFRAVNRVIEGGHEPRRFATDMLDRFRDLIVLASVPDAISTGLLDVPPDRAEALQRPGRAVRPRVAHPRRRPRRRRPRPDARRHVAAAAARADVRAGAAARRGDRRAVAARPPRAARGGRGRRAAPAAGGTSQRPSRTGSACSPAQPRLPTAGRRRAPGSRSRPRPPRPAGRPVGGEPAGRPSRRRPTGSRRTPAGRKRTAGRSRAAAAPAQPAGQQPARRRAASGAACRRSRLRARRCRSAPRPPSRTPPGAPGPRRRRPAPAAPRGTVTVDVLRQAWPGVVEAIKAKGRVAAIVIGNASVASFDEGVLTLRFPRQGDVKGFQGSKYEDLLKQALNAMFGINVVIRAVTGGGDAPSPAPPSGPGPAPAAPARAAAVRPGAGVVLPASRRRRAAARPAAGATGRTRRAPGRGTGVSAGTWRRRRARPARPAGAAGERRGRRHAPVREPGERRRRPAAAAAAPATG